jgi:3-methyladenine DNA glycosylase AlkD
MNQIKSNQIKSNNNWMKLWNVCLEYWSEWSEPSVWWCGRVSSVSCRLLCSSQPLLLSSMRLRSCEVISTHKNDSMRFNLIRFDFVIWVLMWFLKWIWIEVRDTPISALFAHKTRSVKLSTVQNVIRVDTAQPHLLYVTTRFSHSHH